jgi:uncharacterized protein YqjF (DUF2071 family)
MKIKHILKSTEHRPWEIPTENWSFYQEWNNAIFLHWQVEMDELRKYVPEELEIDLFEGKPWVSMVAFTMEKIRPKFLPSFPPLSDFDEINIRTYVKSNEKAGVYFLSIEGGTKISCKVARGISGLPYRYSKINRTKNQFKSSNSEYYDKLNIEFAIGNIIQEKTKLDKWLTEKYALFQDSNNGIDKYEIHHLEWPINEIELIQFDIDYKRFSKLIHRKPNKIGYSKGVEVIAWGKQKTGYNTLYI